MIENELHTNRKGFLSQQQRISFLPKILVGFVVILLLFIIVSALIRIDPLTGQISNNPTAAGLLIGLGVFLVFHNAKLWLDVARGKVVATSGVFQKVAEPTPLALKSYYLAHGPLKLEISQDHFQGLNERLRYQVFYLPRTKQVIAVHYLPHAHSGETQSANLAAGR